MAPKQQKSFTVLEVLPLEIIRYILKECNTSTLKSLRLSCRALETESSAFLFHTVHLDAISQSLDNLIMIASRQELACYVREFIISTNLLEEYDYEAFKRQLCSQDLTCWAETQRQVQSRSRHGLKAFALYCEYLRAQRAILKDRAKLPFIIVQFTNLHDIKVRAVIGIQGSRYWSAINEAIFGNTDDFSGRFWTAIPAVTANGRQLLSTMPGHLRYRHINITSLAVDYIPWYAWTKTALSEPWACLRDLTLCAQHGNTVQEISTVISGLQRFLHGSPALRFLQLEISPSCGYSSSLDFGILLGDNELPFLQQLRLYTGLVSITSLLQICERHRESLDSLRITDFHLKDDRWENMYPLLTSALPRCRLRLQGLTEGDGHSIQTAVPYSQVLEFHAQRSIQSNTFFRAQCTSRSIHKLENGNGSV